MQTRKDKQQNHIHPGIILLIGIILWPLGTFMGGTIGAFVVVLASILVLTSIIHLIINVFRKSGIKDSKEKHSPTHVGKNSLMSEEGKQDIANRFYADERCRSIADAYAQRMDNEAKELLNLDTSLFTDKNPQMQALTTKALIGDHVEKIFQAAYHDKKLKDDEWRQAMGFAKGAATLIAQARTKEQKAFIIALSQFMLVNDYDVPIQQANFLLEGFLGEVKKN